MVWWGGPESGWAWTMLIGMVLFWVLIGVGIWALVRYLGAPRPGPPHQSAEQILAERFARGEISAEEFEERRRVLRSG